MHTVVKYVHAYVQYSAREYVNIQQLQRTKGYSGRCYDHVHLAVMLWPSSDVGKAHPATVFYPALGGSPSSNGCETPHEQNESISALRRQRFLHDEAKVP